MNLKTLILALFALALALFVAPPAPAATSDTLNLRVAQTGGVPVQCAKVTIDFSQQTTQTAAAYVQLFDVQAGEVVIGIASRIITAAGATCTATLGDATTGAAYAAALNLNAAAQTLAWSGPKADLRTTAIVGKYYTAADVIRLTMANATKKGKVVFYKWFIPPPPTTF